MDQIYPIVAYIAALAAATERGVEIIKGFSRWLSTPQPEDPDQERKRKQALQIIAVGVGILTAGLAWPATSKVIPVEWGAGSVTLTIAFGLLASGGSGLWNAILLYLKAVKDDRVRHVTQPVQARPST